MSNNIDQQAFKGMSTHNFEKNGFNKKVKETDNYFDTHVSSKKNKSLTMTIISRLFGVMICFATLLYFFSFKIALIGLSLPALGLMIYMMLMKISKENMKSDQYD